MLNTTTPTPLSAWVGCLGCYNAGTLRGVWVPAEDADDLAAVQDHADEAAPFFARPEWDDEGHCEACGSDEAWAFDLEGFGTILPGEVSPREVASIARAVGELESDGIDREVIAAWVADCDGDARDTDRLREAFAGVYPSPEDHAQELADEEGAHPDSGERGAWLLRYVDWSWVARDLAHDFTYARLEPHDGEGVAVFWNH